MKALTLISILLLSLASFAKDVETISMENCEDIDFVRKHKVLPRGSALITGSGKLKDQGITAIIHAGAASWWNKKEPFGPTKDSLKNSIINSMILAERFKHNRVAIPFLGGGIFFKSLKITLNELADLIVKTAHENSNGTELVFVALEKNQIKAFQTAAKKLNSDSVTVVSGSIIDSKIHGASAIVNAGNMEMKFGTGLSGIIGKATGSKDAIDKEAKQMILSL